jgi:general secretion pathway protein A
MNARSAWASRNAPGTAFQTIKEMDSEMTEYINFYGFSENPFDISPDPKFFFSAESHSEALAGLLYGINQRKGFVLILGEEGIGKTTLIHHLITTLDRNVKTVFFPQSQITFEQMLKEIILTLELPLKVEVKGSMLHELYYYLIRSLEQDENVVIIIDEAHNISLEAIEELRLLSNLETSKSKLLQIVIVGQPELKAKLRSEVIRQINQRIVVSSRISHLTEEESLQYIDHRLKIVGSGSSAIFSDEALSLICRYAKGLPRTINILCSNALSVGYGLSEKQISASSVRKIWREKDILSRDRAQKLSSRIKRNLPRKISYAFLALAIFVMVIFFNKDYVQHVVSSMKLKNVTGLSAFRDKDDSAKPTGKRYVVPEPVPSTPNPEIINVSPETPQTPASSATPMSRPDTEIRIKKIVEAKAGTNLSLLALKYYNKANTTLMDHILEQNPEITDPNLILVDQKIKIPEITESLLLLPSSNGVCKVHLGTFSNPQYAARYIDDIDLPGKKMEVVPRKVSQTGMWYRVLAGPFMSKNEGLKAIEELKRQGLLPSFR